MSDSSRFIGRYEIVDLIAHGGMGSLYRARDPRLQRPVAIKLLREGYDNPELRQRFAREAKAAGRLCHPNIVTIYDVGEHDNRPFIAMEYISGETFAEVIRRREGLPLSRKLQLMEEVCAGLSNAHDEGLVHRDIKPANLMVSSDGSVKILDFGIARTSASSMTEPGMLMGTLSYMAPEQVQGSNVDARADIFAVGAVLYELLSGQPAFKGDIRDGLLHRILNAAPTPLGTICPNLDPQLVRLVDRALEKSPDQRLPKISLMQQGLAEIRQRQPDLDATVRWDLPTQDLRPPPRSTPAPSPSPNPGSDRAKLARLRAQQIEAHLAAVRREFDAGDYEAALAACDQALVIDPDECRAADWIETIHKAANDREQEKMLAEARQHLADGATTVAAELLSRAMALSPNHPDIAPLQDAIEAERTRARAQAVRKALDRAQASAEAGNASLALRELDQVFVLDPGNLQGIALKASIEAAIEAKRQEERIRAAVEEARRRFDAGEHQAAIDSLEALDAGPHSLVATTLAELRRALAGFVRERRAQEERLVRQRRVAGLFSEARAALTRREYALALDLVDEIGGIDRNAPGLSELAALVQQEQAAASAAARLKSQLDSALAEFEERIESGELLHARELVRTASALDSKDPRVAGARNRVERALADRAALDAAAARKRESERKLAEASALFERGDLAAATEAVRQASDLDPGNLHVAEVSAQVKEAIKREAEAAAAEDARRSREIAGKLRDASTHLESKHFSEAMQLTTDVLQLDPSNNAARQLRTAIQKGEQAAKDTAREVEKLLASASKHGDRLRFSKAVSDVERVLRLEPGHRVAEELLSRLHAAEAAYRRSQEVDALLNDAEKAASPERALTLVRQAVDLSPDHLRAQATLLNVEKAIALEQAKARLRSQSLETQAIDENLPETRPELQRSRRFDSLDRMWLWKWELGLAAFVVAMLVAGRSVGSRPGPPPVVPHLAPSPSAGTAKDIALPTPPPPVVSAEIFKVRVTGNYPFEVVLPNGSTRPANRIHQFSLSAQSGQALRLRNQEYFLNLPVQLKGAVMSVSAPVLSDLRVSNTWNETCDIEIDGQAAGFHPLTTQVAVGTHNVGVRCPDGKSTSRSVTVRARGDNTVTFRK